MWTAFKVSLKICFHTPQSGLAVQLPASDACLPLSMQGGNTLFFLCMCVCVCVCMHVMDDQCVLALIVMSALCCGNPGGEL